jgi:hypothetical protein
VSIKQWRHPVADCLPAPVLGNAQESGDLPPLPPGGRRMIPAGSLGINPYGMVQLSAGEQLREASDRLKRLQATAAGPPALKDTITVRLGASLRQSAASSNSCLLMLCAHAPSWLAQFVMFWSALAANTLCPTALWAVIASSIGAPQAT